MRIAIRSWRSFVGMMLAAGFAAGDASAAGDPTGPMAAPRAGHAQVALPDGRALIIGGSVGWGSTLQPTATVEIYNPSTNTISFTTSLSVPRGGAFAVLLADGRVLAGSGTTAETFDPATLLWTPTPGALTTSRSGARAFALPDGRALILSGLTSEVFDPVTGTFTASGSLIANRTGYAASVLSDGRVVVVGGQVPSTTNLVTSVEHWDPVTGNWSAAGSINLGRSYATATTLADGRVLVTGGTTTGSIFGLVPAAELYDPATGASNLTGSLNVPRYSHAAALLGDGAVLVSGGQANSGFRNGDYERYDVVTGTWRNVGAMIVTRNDHRMTSLPNGDVLSTGGRDIFSTYLQSGEVVDSACVAVDAILSPTSATFTAAGGSSSIAVSRLPGCSWRILRAPSWMTITSGATGVGDGVVNYTVAVQPASSGRGSMMAVADIDFQLNQDGNWCASGTSISPTTQSFAVGGGSATVSVTAGGACAWTVSNVPSWMTIASGGTGSQALSYTVAANPGGARSANVTVASGTLAVSQAANLCPTAPTISPASQSFSASAGSGSVTITAPAGCPWTVTGIPAWLSIAASGTGTTTLNYSVGTNSGAARNVTLTIAGNAFAVSQAANPCLIAPTITPTARTLPKSGGTGTVTVTAATGCTWSVGTPPAWITITSGAPGNGNGVVSYTVAPNVGAQRSATFTVANVNHTVTELAAGGATDVTGSMVSPRYAHAAVRLADARVLVAGGFATSLQVPSGTAVAELYDPLSGTFAATASMLEARGGHGYALLADGRVLVAGGVGTGATPLASAEIYDPVAGTWTATGGMSEVRRQPDAVALPDGRVLVIGGDTTVGSVDIYDPATGTFAATGSLLTARFRPAVALLNDGRVLVVGGQAGPSTYLASSEVWDPVTGTWSATGDIAPARGEATATTLADGRVLVAGGSAGSSPFVSSAIYDPLSGTFSATGNLLTSRTSHAAVRLADGTVAVTGGFAASIRQERFNPATGTWAHAGQPWKGRQQHTATVLANGKVLMAGGRPWADPETAITAELYDPSACASLPTLSPSAQTFLWNGGSGTLSVTVNAAQPACAWTVSPVPDWITITSSASGTGNATVTYSVASNPGASRSATLGIAGATSQVSQNGNPCTTALGTITPSSANFGGAGGSGTIALTFTATCPWTVQGVPAWVTITSGASGTGNGTVAYTVAANDGAARNATLTLAGRSFTLSQLAAGAAAPCDFVGSVSAAGSYSGTLSSTDCKEGARGTSYNTDRYSFTASPGQQVAFLLTSSAFDTYLYLRNPAGTVITSNDDGGGGTNSRIPASSGVFTLPAGSAGTYVIEVTSYSSGVTGAYTLQRIQ